MARAPAKKAAPALPVARPVVKDKAAIDAVAEYAAAKSDIAVLEARVKELKPVILACMGESKSVVVGNHIVTRADFDAMPPKPNQVITKEMVGQVIPGSKGKSGYSTLTVQ